MQDTAYVKINGKNILVLRRLVKYGFKIRLRKSGHLGSFLSEESDFLENSPNHLADLLSGKTIYL